MNRPKFAGQRGDGPEGIREPMRSIGEEPAASNVFMWIVLVVAGALVLLIVVDLLVQLFLFLASRTKKPLDDKGRTASFSHAESFSSSARAALFAADRRVAAQARPPERGPWKPTRCSSPAGALAGPRANPTRRLVNTRCALAAAFPGTAGAQNRASLHRPSGGKRSLRRRGPPTPRPTAHLARLRPQPQPSRLPCRTTETRFAAAQAEALSASPQLSALVTVRRTRQ